MRCAPLVAAFAAASGCTHVAPPGATAPAEPAATPALAGEEVLRRQPSPGPLKPFDAPVPARIELANGLALYIIERPGDAIEALHLVVRRGASSDPARLPGLASLTAAMLETGSAGRTQTQIAEAADALGASLHAGAGEDATAVSISGLGSHIGEMVALLGDVALRPNFSADEWDRLKGRVLSGLQASRAEPRVAATLAFSAAVYGKNPLARPVPGTPESVSRLSLQDARAFFEGFHPGESALIAAGGVPPGQLVPLLRQAFGEWRGNGSRPLRSSSREAPPPPRDRPRLVLVDFAGKPQSVVQVGAPSVSRSSPDVLALRLLGSVLGGSFTSRLNQNLRETHGYAYGASSAFAFGEGPGPFVAVANVKTEVTGAAVAEMLSEIRRALAEPISPEELRKGKALLTFELLSLLEHADAAAAGAASIYLYGLPLDELRTFVPRLSALDAAAVQAAGRRALDPEGLTVVIAGDVAKVRPQLETAGLALGPGELRDAEGRLVSAPAPRR